MNAKKSNPVTAMHTGKPGRPAAVRAKAERIIYKAIFDATMTETGCQIIPEGVPNSYRAAFAGITMECIWHTLHAAGLRIVPARFLSEMACFSGEPIAADDPGLPKPAKPADGP